jgi:hypothetical protein
MVGGFSKIRILLKTFDGKLREDAPSKLGG